MTVGAPGSERHNASTLLDANLEAPGTSGRPVPGYELRLVDEQGFELDPDHPQPGDLEVRGDSCAAYYWRPEDPDSLAEQLRQWCKGNLRRYEYPHVVEFVEDLPRTPTGKVQRYKLREADEVQATLAGAG